MKITLLLKRPYGEFQNYSPGHLFNVEITELKVATNDPTLSGLNLDDQDLENFKLIGETCDLPTLR